MTTKPQAFSDILSKYMSVIRLLDDTGPWKNRLESVYRMVKDPKFLYVESPIGVFLSAILVNSSYWLDAELFDGKIIQKNLNDKTLNDTQKDHLYLLDIGSVLMDKGFPLNQKMLDKCCPENSPLYSWAKTFLIQCHQRNVWLKSNQSLSHKRQLHLPCHQKIR